MVEAIIESLQEIPPGWRVFILSMLPVTELRGAIPLGLFWGLDPLLAYLWAVSGNFVPVVPLLLGLKAFFRFLAHKGFFRKLVNWLRQHTAANQEKVRRCGMVGLCLLVAVPLPGTGVWTGALVASFLNLPFLPSLLSITLGELLAGLLVSLFMSGAVAVSQMQYGFWFLLALALLLIFFLLRKRIKK
ncbi:MAG: small multi-drug export protein [Bacillota bacterium]|nr:small multi-drug export protein [Bacillota bacterium]